MGHTIDFGPFRKEGLLTDKYLWIPALLDLWGWWPQSMQGMNLADIGCFTGGMSLAMAARGAGTVWAVDEVAAHLDQCRYLASLFPFQQFVASSSRSTGSVTQSRKPVAIPFGPRTGVLYHLSDMMVGLLMMGRLLKPGGTLIIETTAVNDFEHSYANFGRFWAGMWWQPTGLCIEDMCRLMGFEQIDVRFYISDRCLVKCVWPTTPYIPFRRGINWEFDSIRDAESRTMDDSVLALAPAVTMTDRC